MTTVRLKGGIGNQMFQYASGRARSLGNKTGLLLDISYFDFKLPGITERKYSLDVFNVSGKIVKRSFFKFILERVFSREEYFQSPKYFEGYEEIIRKDFTLKAPLVGGSVELLAEIKNCASVCVHVRRGDYVGNVTHPVLDLDYYKRGIEYMSQRSKIDKVYVFSDDIEWCKNNLQFEYEVVFVSAESGGKHGEVHIMLMSACKNFIIANSTFSWWGAWLSDNPNKVVVVSERWFSDHKADSKYLIPDSWIRL